MAGRPRATTIAEVARLSGVSPATVSRVMNGRFLGEPEIAERIRAVAAELDYSPNHLARSFALGQTNAIALLVPDLTNPGFHAALTGLSKAAAVDGYRVLVADSAESTSDEPLLAAEIRRRCDAIVLCAPRMPDDELARLAQSLRPLVLIHRSSPLVAVPTLSVDSQAGFEILGQHLHSLGHRRMAYLEGPEGVANSNRLRGLAELTLSHPDVTIVNIPGGARSEDGAAAVDAVLASGATAVLAFNDLAAIGLMHGLIGRGVRVPDEISITGFDDIPFARYMSPALTTVSVPHEVLGELAWVRMKALINDESPDHNVVFQPRLEIRGSTAPPPS